MSNGNLFMRSCVAWLCGDVAWLGGCGVVERVWRGYEGVAWLRGCGVAKWECGLARRVWRDAKLLPRLPATRRKF